MERISSRAIWSADFDKRITALSHETSASTADSQIISLNATGADVLICGSTAKFVAQSIRKAYDLGWKATHFIASVAASINGVIKPAGFDRATGVISSAYLKDASDPEWANDKGVAEYVAFTKARYPHGNPSGLYCIYGYTVALVLMQVLKQAGGDLSRENIMKQAESLKDVDIPTLLPGIKVDTSPTDHRPLWQSAASRRAARQAARGVRAAIDMLATIHRTDVAAVGLSGFGRPGHYYQRQLHRWGKQIASALPEGDRPPRLLHGDSRLDNLMFDSAGERIVAVLDWELSTLGNPLADLGQFLAVQDLPCDYLLPGLSGLDRAEMGIPSEDEQAARYFAASGEPPAEMRFYKAFAMFRQAAMSAGLKRRAALGTALTEEARGFGETLSVFAELGLALLRGR